MVAGIAGGPVGMVIGAVVGAAAGAGSGAGLASAINNKDKHAEKADMRWTPPHSTATHRIIPRPIHPTGVCASGASSYSNALRHVRTK